MYDAGARHGLEPRQVMQQAVHERAARIAGARVHHEASRFVEDEQVLVLEHDVEFYGLRCDAHLGLGSRLEFDDLSARHLVAGAFRPAVDAYRAVQQPLLEAAPGILRKHLCERLVQTQTGEFRGHRFSVFLGSHDYR